MKREEDIAPALLKKLQEDFKKEFKGNREIAVHGVRRRLAAIAILMCRRMFTADIITVSAPWTTIPEAV